MNIASIIETAQVMDLTILRIFGRTGGLEFYPHFGWYWADTPGSLVSFLFHFCLFVFVRTGGLDHPKGGQNYWADTLCFFFVCFFFV